MASEWGARDFIEQPLTAEEMAQAIERAWQDHMARVIEPDQHAITLQEAAKALRRGRQLQEANVEAMKHLRAATDYIAEATATLSLAQSTKLPGREL